MCFIHFASLMEGGKLAWLGPVNKENSFVQNVAARGLPRCKVNRHDTSDFIVIYVVSLGNDTNADAAETNHLQTYRASGTDECSWNRKKRQESCMIESLGQGTCENLEIELWADSPRLLAVGNSSASMKGAGVSSGMLRKSRLRVARRYGPPTTIGARRHATSKILQASSDKNHMARFLQEQLCNHGKEWLETP